MWYLKSCLRSLNVEFKLLFHKETFTLISPFSLIQPCRKGGVMRGHRSRETPVVYGEAVPLQVIVLNLYHSLSNILSIYYYRWFFLYASSLSPLISLQNWLWIFLKQSFDFFSKFSLCLPKLTKIVKKHLNICRPNCLSLSSQAKWNLYFNILVSSSEVIIEKSLNLSFLI